MGEDLLDHNGLPVDRTFYIDVSGDRFYKVIRPVCSGELRYFECKSDGSNQTFRSLDEVPVLTENVAHDFIRIENPGALRCFLGDHNLLKVCESCDGFPTH